MASSVDYCHQTIPQAVKELLSKRDEITYLGWKAFGHVM